MARLTWLGAPACVACGQPNELHMLLATDSRDDNDLKPFWFCGNKSCRKGPVLIRELRDPEEAA